jgi:hypothetical protein
MHSRSLSATQAFMLVSDVLDVVIRVMGRVCAFYIFNHSLYSEEVMSVYYDTPLLFNPYSYYILLNTKEEEIYAEWFCSSRFVCTISKH